MAASARQRALILKRPWHTVLLPTCNGSEWLGEALESLVAQQDRDMEVIAIDDGSSDDTVDILRAYEDRLDLRILLRLHDGNWCARTNEALRLARGSFVSILHQDDSWSPGRSVVLRALVRDHPHAALFTHATTLIDGAGRPLGVRRCPLASAPRENAPGKVLPLLLIQNFLLVPAVLFRRDAALAHGGLDERLWFLGDWDLWLKLCREGVTVYCPRSLGRFRLHAQSQTMTRARNVADVTRQYQAIHDRHLPPAPTRTSAGRSIARAAAFSTAVNVALLRVVSGEPLRFGALVRQGLALGPRGAMAYWRASKLWERSWTRLAARLLPPRSTVARAFTLGTDTSARKHAVQDQAARGQRK